MEEENVKRELLLSRLITRKHYNNNNCQTAIELANVSNTLRENKRLSFLCNITSEENEACSKEFEHLGDIYLSDIAAITEACSNEHVLQETLLTANACTSDSSYRENLLINNEENTIVRKRWIRCIMSLCSSPLNIFEKTCGKEELTWENTILQHMCIRMRVRLVTLDNTESKLIEQTIGEAEAQLAHVLIHILCSLKDQIANCTEFTVAEAENNYYIDVPVYTIQIHMLDTAATRLSKLVNYTNNIIEYFIDPMSLSDNYCCCISNSINNNISVNKSATQLLLYCNTYILQFLYSVVLKRNVSSVEEVDALLRILQSVAEKYNVTATNTNNTTTITYNNNNGNGKFHDDNNHIGLRQVWAMLTANCTNHFLSILHPPSVLVHCICGVSRSPSIILLFLLHRLVKRYSDLAHNFTNATSSELITSITLLECLDAIRSVRPQAQPNIAFMMEMQSLWRHSLASNVNISDALQ